MARPFNGKIATDVRNSGAEGDEERLTDFTT